MTDFFAKVASWQPLGASVTSDEPRWEVQWQGALPLYREAAASGGLFGSSAGLFGVPGGFFGVPGGLLGSLLSRLGASWRHLGTS